MALLTPAERRECECFRDLAFVNPFLPERVELERRALGDAFVPWGLARAPRPDLEPDPNTRTLLARSAELLARLQARAAGGKRADASELELCGHLAVFVLYHRFHDRMTAVALALDEPVARVRAPWFAEFERETEQHLRLGDARLLPEEDAPRLLALLVQIARCFHNVFVRIGGRSEAAVRLRAEIWQSVFTHDLLRYRRCLQDRMVEVPTLVTGPSGTGKELVAAAIGRSGHVPFDVDKSAFVLEEGELFLPLAISSLSPNLVESELFGHRRGAFTGALEDRAGWFERCPGYGTVFLDELGEIDAEIQVKLLRVLQTRAFERIGEHEPRRFRGRLVSATNRDLAAEIERGTFREDLYYRICADRIETPALRDLIAGDAGELEHLVNFATSKLVGERTAGETAEARELAAEVSRWIESNLGLDHPWPGNFRELEQCVRSYLVRGTYRPSLANDGEARSRSNALGDAVRAGELTADELLDRYCAQVYDHVGTYEGAARALGLDRRTVKARAERARTSD
ncbi:Nitrogen assimilation regulatory protein [Planctomycetes bacterium Pla163]|uniref:Nitrogen assimilation regulatory protein n=1 Tax=Rohdeia mirabilis TaxID=2528008 RepID=A0A518CX64_9BACT|nr:Nitrogen assimilation regulatory protein [Planctomycetes bacterium Pla163]